RVTSDCLSKACNQHTRPHLSIQEDGNRHFWPYGQFHPWRTGNRFDSLLVYSTHLVLVPLHREYAGQIPSCSWPRQAFSLFPKSLDSVHQSRLAFLYRGRSFCDFRLGLTLPRKEEHRDNRL